MSYQGSRNYLRGNNIGGEIMEAVLMCHIYIDIDIYKGQFLELF